MNVYVQDKNGNPLMPTGRCGKVKHLLREGRATVVSRCPFTIRLTYDSKTYTQPLTLGLKTGTREFGVAVARDTFGVLKRHPEGTVFAASSLVTVKKGRGEYLTARDISPVDAEGQESDLFRSELKKEYESLTKSA